MKHHKRIKLEDGQNRDLHGPGAGAGVGTQVRGVGGGQRIPEFIIAESRVNVSNIGP